MPDVDFVMSKVVERVNKLLLYVACIPAWAKKDRSLVIIKAMDSKTVFIEETADFRANKTG